MITREEKIDFIRLSIRHFPRLPAQVIIAARLLGPNLGSAPSQRPPRTNPWPEEAQQPATEYSPPSLKTNNVPIFGSTLDYFYFRFRRDSDHLAGAKLVGKHENKAKIPVEIMANNSVSV